MGELISVGLLGLSQKPHALYRFFDRTDAVLYIGITLDFPVRMTSHRREKPWWTLVEHITIEHFDTREEALAAETEAIRTEKPLYNVTHNELVLAPHLSTPTQDEIARARDDGMRELAEEILGNTDDDEIACLVRRASGLPESERWGDDRVDAARLLAGEMASHRWRLDDALYRIFRHLPSDVLKKCEQEAADLQGRYPEYQEDEYERSARVAYFCAVWLAATYLFTLPEDERDAWFACAAALPSNTGNHLILAAAEYARDFKEHGKVPEWMCVGPGEHGARCPSLATWDGSGPHLLDVERRVCDRHREEAIRRLIDDPETRCGAARSFTQCRNPHVKPEPAPTLAELAEF